MAQVSVFCPNCGTNISYQIQAQAFVCDSCQSRFTAAEMMERAPDIDHDALWREVAEREAAAEAQGARAERVTGGDFGGEVGSYECPSCGAHVVVAGSEATTTCAFCGNHVAVTARLRAGDEPPSRILPFRVTRQAAARIVRDACKRKPFLPRWFRQKERERDLRCVYVPYWLLDASLDGSVVATCKNYTRWSDSDYDYTKEDVYEARRAGGLDIEALPLDGSEKMDDRLMRSLDPYDNRELVPYAVHYLSGFAAESPNTPMESLLKAFEQLALPTIVQGLRSTIDGYGSVDVREHHASMHATRSEYVMYPVWLLSTRLGKKEHMLAINGQTGKLTGSLPFSFAQLLKWAGVFLGAGTLLAFIALEVMVWLA